MKDITLGDLLEGMVLHGFEGRAPFGVGVVLPRFLRSGMAEGAIPPVGMASSLAFVSSVETADYGPALVLRTTPGVCRGGASEQDWKSTVTAIVESRGFLINLRVDSKVAPSEKLDGLSSKNLCHRVALKGSPVA